MLPRPRPCAAACRAPRLHHPCGAVHRAPLPRCLCPHVEGHAETPPSAPERQVRIWSMKSVDKNTANDDSNPMLLATMQDHFGSVNCVRWAKHGRYLASGSDDRVILIHERKAGSETSEFGSGELPDIENRKVVMTLRGHTADVLGSTFFRRLAWSPCGYFMTTTHGFQKPRHSTPVLERGEWSATFDFLGHNAPVGG